MYRSLELCTYEATFFDRYGTAAEEVKAVENVETLQDIDVVEGNKPFVF